MTLNDFITLKELLNGLRSEMDADYARRIEAIGWPGSKSIWYEAKEKLEAVDAVIELVGVYQLNSPALEQGVTI